MTKIRKADGGVCYEWYKMVVHFWSTGARSMVFLFVLSEGKGKKSGSFSAFGSENCTYSSDNRIASSNRRCIFRWRRGH